MNPSSETPRETPARRRVYLKTDDFRVPKADTPRLNAARELPTRDFINEVAAMERELAAARGRLEALEREPRVYCAADNESVVVTLPGGAGAVFRPSCQIAREVARRIAAMPAVPSGRARVCLCGGKDDLSGHLPGCPKASA